MPAPGSVPVKQPVPWDPAQPYRGLGFRNVNLKTGTHGHPISEYGVKGEEYENPRIGRLHDAAVFAVNSGLLPFCGRERPGDKGHGKEVRVFAPKEIVVKKGVPVVLEFTSLDTMHGFSCPGLKIRTDIPPGKINTLRFVPDKAGTFPCHCDNFCGTGHEGMRGSIKVVE